VGKYDLTSTAENNLYLTFAEVLGRIRWGWENLNSFPQQRLMLSYICRTCGDDELSLGIFDLTSTVIMLSFILQKFRR
jgi:hypothetical protein